MQATLASTRKNTKGRRGETQGDLRAGWQEEEGASPGGVSTGSGCEARLDLVSSNRIAALDWLHDFANQLQREFSRL